MIIGQVAYLMNINTKIIIILFLIYYIDKFKILKKLLSIRGIGWLGPGYGLDNPCECGVKSSGSISHGVSFCICFDGVVITAQYTATFSDLLRSPEFRYY